MLIFGKLYEVFRQTSTILISIFNQHCLAYCFTFTIEFIKPYFVFLGDASSIIGLQGALKFHGGGHINHSIFWQNLCPISQSGEPSADLMAAIIKDFGSLENLQTQLSASTVAVQGSGWGWLGFNKAEKKLQVATCANQDPLEATTGLVPLFGIDVWEHAYYLQYKNVRPDYVKAIWQVANWADISGRFANASVLAFSSQKVAYLPDFVVCA